MTISFVGTTPVGASASGPSTTTTISLPAGTAEGDVLVAVVVFSGGGSTIDTPAGWTQLASIDSRSASYVRVAPASPPASYTWTHGNAFYRGGMVAYRGATILATGGATGARATYANDKEHEASLTLPSALSGGLVVQVASCDFNGTWTTSGTKRIDTTGEPSVVVVDTSGITAPSGSYSPPSLVHVSSLANHEWTIGVVALAPAGPTTPTVSAASSGSGTLSASVVEVEKAAASSSGVGTLTASVSVVGGTLVSANLTGSGTLSAAVEVVSGEPPFGVGTDLSRTGGRSRGGTSVATWEPAVVLPPSIIFGEHRMIHAAAFGPVAMVGTQPTFTVSQAWTPRARTRILVGGKDISFYRDIPTPEPEYQLAEPLGWGPSSIEFPQIAAAYETPGVGDLSWCAKGKPVTYQRVDAAGNILAVDYRGIVVAHDLAGKTLRLEVGGHGQGRAVLRHKPGPIFRDTLDIGRLAWAAIRDLGLRFEPRMGPTTGIKSALFGNMGFLDYISELCAKAWQRNGTQWTLMPDDSGLYSLTQKDTTTVHWTVFNDDSRNVASLRSDAAEEHNRVFGSGVTPKGQRVRNGVYPGLTPGPAAPYPFADNSVFGLGTADEDTDTGDGITVMLRRLWTAGYLSLEDAQGFYDVDITRVVMSLQADAGLPTNGNVNVATWEALFDVPGTSYTTRGAQVVPMAEANNVRRENRSSSGQFIGRNPAYDPSVLRVDRAIDFGSGFTRNQMREWAHAEVARGSNNWTGTLTLHGGAVLAGNVAVGATIDAADLTDVRAIRPGHNVSLPLFAGGILLHVSGVEINRGEDGRPVAVLTVDTQARDAMEVWEIIRRNRESRRDPARRMKGNRASSEIKDSISEWDEIGGVLDGDRELVPGWNRVRVVGGEEGTVSRIKTLVFNPGAFEGTTVGVEYAVAVFGKPMTVARLTELVPNPLGVDGDKKWRDRSEELEKAGALYSAGTEAEPCGYGRQKKTDDGAELTGFHIDDAGFSYRCGPDHLLDLLVWVDEACTLRGGRIMRNQLEAAA